ncbi:glyoxylase-like metal-dependent hydrolase (beta-lactamase superfamily II) [Virgibacillus natechei]|uniref:Glyoxylase-like metal-dependent hydrolase (Beta-lactamase superfamily II) n=1 Tax=Virgibacillus natechei TaxID=1216297 RepID=A0ABS4IFJ0_9BACI|nr:MBL fold metallo-hydrolase [Virgibacillus natechei]MBP1969675.1 glyoxylase-like metal-dependent hydrolase (beta-lactamase superfamily II) [Virgibacillus natechei]UZD11402.1 MBL fold metallo-hydrolase [Virgibacillus natechei]
MKVLDKTISQLTIPTPFAVGNTHVYLIKGDLLTLVDAGVKTTEAWEALKTQLKEIGYSPNDIEQIILTHHHPDHTGLVEEFPRAERLVAHKNVDLWLTRNETYFQHYEQFFKEYFIASGIPQHFHRLLDNLRAPLKYAGEGHLTSTIIEGDSLPGHEDWRVVETKGHAQSHLSFYRETDGSFIGGDHLLRHISPNPLIEPHPDMDQEGRPKPILQYRANLKKCMSLGIQSVLPGHGDIFSNVEEIIPRHLHKQEQRAKKVELLLMDNPQTPFQICMQIFPHQYEKQLDLTMSETIAQLDYLENEGKVDKTIEDGIFFYHAKKSSK